MLRMINTPDAPNANGHYSQAIVANGFVFVSGQLPVTPYTHGELAQGVEAQMHQLISNLSNMLEVAKSNLNRLVSVTVFVTDIDLWPTVDRVYRDRMSKHRPARAIVVSPQLHLGASVALQAVAVVDTPVARARAALARWVGNRCWPVSPAWEIGSRSASREPTSGASANGPPPLTPGHMNSLDRASC